MARVDGIEKSFAKLEAGVTTLTDRLSKLDDKIDAWDERLSSKPSSQPVVFNMRSKRNRRFGASKR